MPQPVTLVWEAINAAVERFQKNPFDFLYESDLRTFVFTVLFESYDAMPLTIRNTTKVGFPTDIRINPVKTEYPATLRFDIALIDADYLIHSCPQDPMPDFFNDILPQGWPTGKWQPPLWEQPVRVAIETKYDQPGLQQMEEGIGEDLKKLHEYSTKSPCWRGVNGRTQTLLPYAAGRDFLGISLVFVQPHPTLDALRLARGAEVIQGGNPETGVFQYLVTQGGRRLSKCP